MERVALRGELDAEICLHIYRKMLTIRHFEDVSGAAYKRGEFWGPTHSGLRLVPSRCSHGERSCTRGRRYRFRPDLPLLRRYTRPQTTSHTQLFKLQDFPLARLGDFRAFAFV